MEQFLVPGHTLEYEGRGYRDDDCAECQQFGSGSYYWHSVKGHGHAHCSCRAESPHFTTGAARKRWHRDHKREVLYGKPTSPPMEQL